MQLIFPVCLAALLFRRFAERLVAFLTPFVAASMFATLPKIKAQLKEMFAKGTTRY
ncbi:MAG: hypothetical protein RIQ60_692 [Pseudomonadota bacterium]